MSLLPNREELLLLSTQIEEAVNLYGVSMTLYERSTESLHLDDVALGKGTLIKGVIQNNPTKRLLDNLGWYKEFRETESTMVYVPYTINGNTLVVKDRYVLLLEDGLALTVTSVNRQYLMGMWQILNCTPYNRDNKELFKSEMGTKTRFLNTDKEEVY